MRPKIGFVIRHNRTPGLGHLVESLANPLYALALPERHLETYERNQKPNAHRKNLCDKLLTADVRRGVDAVHRRQHSGEPEKGVKDRENADDDQDCFHDAPLPAVVDE